MHQILQPLWRLSQLLGYQVQDGLHGFKPGRQSLLRKLPLLFKKNPVSFHQVEWTTFCPLALPATDFRTEKSWQMNWFQMPSQILPGNSTHCTNGWCLCCAVFLVISWVTQFKSIMGSLRLCNWLSLWRLVSWINHLPPACWSTFWKSNLKQQLGCRFDIMDNESYFF